MGYCVRLKHRRSCRGIATQGQPPGVLPPRLPCVLLCLLRGALGSMAGLELLEEQRLLAVNRVQRWKSEFVNPGTALLWCRTLELPVWLQLPREAAPVEIL